MLVVKKYPNRRLYDTTLSRYITLEDLAERIKGGADVRVLDAHTNADLTQTTLTQIILESRGAARLLPVPLLVRLIRLGDEALAEFFGRYVSWALELYVQARQGARALMPLNPLATAPFAATDALARLVLGAAQWGNPGAPPSPIPPMPVPEAADSVPPPPPSDLDASETGAGASSASEEEEETGHVAEGVEAEMLRLRREIEALKRSMGAPPVPARRSPKKTTAKTPKKR
ncbi:hypothetical protein AKJ09_01845 [Labilithrix luteola]|uniref:PHA accumulation regulator DNA-binding N-terminal domain-containing protein n=1 Tax=Labilithrix luteola TaxID=1391654 RepID=A0A0K1PP47_9BACT|nr:polyhydroxyalkanoate synthesis regulator DNA-binding domain-containing protein [Labilithrix luteola]AKU95181.1 hypothetical protein AKJ09_01845 [Labilithrix luteola]